MDIIDEARDRSKQIRSTLPTVAALLDRLIKHTEELSIQLSFEREQHKQMLDADGQTRQETLETLESTTAALSSSREQLDAAREEARSAREVAEGLREQVGLKDDSHTVWRLRCLNLLARIHRDGGQYVDAHGILKAYDDAHAVVAHHAISEASLRTQWRQAGLEERLAIVAWLQAEWPTLKQLTLEDAFNHLLKNIREGAWKLP